jgi:hypothetical protein
VLGKTLRYGSLTKHFPEKQNRKILNFLFFSVRLADSINTLKIYNPHAALVETCTHRNPFLKQPALKIIRSHNKKNKSERKLPATGSPKM